MAFVSPAAIVGFALVMFVLPLVVAGWMAYDAKRRGLLGSAFVWVVVAAFTTLFGAFVSLYVYVTRVRSTAE